MASRTAGFWGHALVSALAVFSLAAHALTLSQVFEAVKDSAVVVKTLDAKGAMHKTRVASPYPQPYHPAPRSYAW
jgi:hypothetical protein